MHDQHASSRSCGSLPSASSAATAPHHLPQAPLAALCACADNDCSGIPAKPPLMQRLASIGAASPAACTHMLTVREAQRRLARTILAHPGAAWAKRLYVPAEQLSADMELLELRHANTSKCAGMHYRGASFVHAAHVPSRAGQGGQQQLFAVKQVSFTVDPRVVTEKRSEDLPDLALAELCGLEGISGRPGCQRLLAWSVAQCDIGGTEAGTFRLVLVTELYSRGSLAQLLRGGSHSCGNGSGYSCCGVAQPHVLEVLEPLRQVAATLASLQAERPCTVHCDLKPDNILLRADGMAEVIDWEGKVEFDEPAKPATARKADRDDHPTSIAKIHSRGFFCTASHAGPELLLPHLAAGMLPPGTRALRQWQALSLEERERLAPHWALTPPGRLPDAYVTRRSDVYSLGVMIAEALERCRFDGVLAAVESQLRALADACCATMPWERPSVLRVSEHLNRLVGALHQQ